MALQPLTELLAVWRDGRRLSNDDVLALDSDSRSDEAVRVELLVRPHLHPERVVPGGLLELLHDLHTDLLLDVL